MGEMTHETFRSEFATAAGRRRLGYREGDPWQGRVDRLLGDDAELQGEYLQWQHRRKRRVERAQRQLMDTRRRNGAMTGVLLIVAGVVLVLVGVNTAAHHQQQVSGGPCYQRPHLYGDATTTVCPAHMEPLHDGTWLAATTLGWLGVAVLVTGGVLIVRHPNF
ncbi:hypothetical protein [Curtobacterium sp. Leaf154]|uniref:hypothetical protein n=1 Tax=Curtobacterium sp. Leaf154 TaxID=1736277 RepID=UPI0006F4FA7E|nr:hypothetical protein [Curtobacterium sp. Leaf154]KQR29794.1 hypothetical protein ASF75_11500 [Curtobacterium sp. Leaf154]